MGRSWPVEDLYYGLMRRFLRRVVLDQPEALARVQGRPLMYLANHQVGIESLLFAVLASGLNGVPTVTVAKAEHRSTWLGHLITLCFQYPGVLDPKVITYFDRDDKSSLVGIIAELARGLRSPQRSKGGELAPGQSVMVHVEGTRSLECRTPVQKMSGAFIDMALQTGTPIVPVRFVGGLPALALERRIEYPLGLGTQDVWLGAPIHPEELAKMPYGERKKRVMQAINELGPNNAVEQPHEADPHLEEAVQSWMARSGASHEHAVLYEVLRAQGDLCEETGALIEAIGRGAPLEGDEPADDWLRALRARLDPRAGVTP
jgi:1-acyl-sn-glycerol-3-phosphate acyltransferase